MLFPHIRLIDPINHHKHHNKAPGSEFTINRCDKKFDTDNITYCTRLSKTLPEWIIKQVRFLCTLVLPFIMPYFKEENCVLNNITGKWMKFFGIFVSRDKNYAFYLFFKLFKISLQSKNKTCWFGHLCLMYLVKTIQQ